MDLSSVLYVGAGLIRPPNPNIAYARKLEESREYYRNKRTPQPPQSTTDKVKEALSVGTTASSILTGLGELTPAPAVEAISQAATPYRDTIVASVRNVTQTVTQTVSSKIPETLKDGVSGIAGDLRSAGSWALWGFQRLPAKVQVGLGLFTLIGGAWFIRTLFRPGSGSCIVTSTHHINFHNLPSSCKVIKRQEGSSTVTTVDCSGTEAIKSSSRNRLVEKYHTRLLTHYKEQNRVLSQDLQDRLEVLLAELDDAKVTNYKDVPAPLLITILKIDREIKAEIKEYTRKTIDAWQNHGLINRIKNTFSTRTRSH